MPTWPAPWTLRSRPARCWPASPSTYALIDAGAADIIQPDAPRIGGITQFLKLATLAESKQLEIAPHFAMEIHCHLAAAYPIEPWVEHFDWLDPLFNEHLETRDGRMWVSDRPGLGFTLSEQAQRLDDRHRRVRFPALTSNGSARPRVTIRMQAARLLGTTRELTMVVLGIILLVLGWLLDISILVTIGIIVLVIGLVLLLLGGLNRPVLGRRYWF